MPNVELTSTNCWCGLPFAMPSRLYENCKQNGDSFYCPLGHSITFKETQVDKYRREAERLKQRVAQRDDTITSLERSVAAHKGQLTKIKKRTSAGVCPCCNRTFQHLRRHMASKHPNFADEPDLKVVSGGKP